MTPQQMHELNQAGKSCSEIAREIGVSKNSVVGKIYRYKKANNITAMPDKERMDRTHRRTIPRKKPVKKRPVKVQPTPHNVTIAEIKASQCRYPVTDDKPYLFCGARVTEKSVYCEHHHERCYVSRKSKPWYERKAK